MALAPRPTAQKQATVDEKIVTVIDKKSGNEFKVTKAYFDLNKSTLKRA